RDVGEGLAVELRRPFEGRALLVLVRVVALEVGVAPRCLRRDVRLRRRLRGCGRLRPRRRRHPCRERGDHRNREQALTHSPTPVFAPDPPALPAPPDLPDPCPDLEANTTGPRYNRARSTPPG